MLFRRFKCFVLANVFARFAALSVQHLADVEAELLEARDELERIEARTRAIARRGRFFSDQALRYARETVQ